MDAGKAFMKLTRGVINIGTGWVEIPKRVQETSQASGSAAGFTWGILRGIGHGFIRTAAGLYELVTFPFPAPPDYSPVIQPEYVFSVELPEG
jgi:putative exosortase-associated protein (TIGR04073 family)